MTEFQTPAQSGQAAALPKTYVQHPLSAAFPAMTPEEFQKLKDSIENIGPMSPVVITQGMVLDGWNIYRACIELDMDCPVQELAAHVGPQEYLDAQNIGRKAQKRHDSAAKHQCITLKLLEASSQPRPLITADVDTLAASIREIGLIQPITVRPLVVMNGIAEQGFQIVAGHHRVAACRALGWTEIDAIVIKSSGHLQAELIEIDENLCRSELTPAQRAHYTARRAQISEALAPYVPVKFQEKREGETEVGKVCPPQFAGQLGGARPQAKAFAAETAALTGESKRSINQHRARGEALGGDTLRVVGTSLDKGVELDALARLPEPERKELIGRAQTGEKVTARPVSVVPPPPSSASPSPWDALPPGDSTAPEGDPDDYGPSEEEIAEAEAAEKAERELVEKMLAADDKVAMLFAEVKMLKAQVDRLERYRDELMNKSSALEQIAKKRDRENLRLVKELDAIKKGGAR